MRQYWMWHSVGVALLLVLASAGVASSGPIEAKIWAASHTGTVSIVNGDSFVGDSSDLLPMHVADEDADGNRFAEARLNSQSLYAASHGRGTGVFDVPSAFAELRGSFVFENNQALQDQIAANGGAPLDMFATYHMIFFLERSPVPGGIFAPIFNQTNSTTIASISANNNITNNSVFGKLVAGNGVGSEGLEISGVLTADKIAILFPVEVAFKISNTSPDLLSVYTHAQVVTESLSLGELPISASAQLFYPKQDEVFVRFASTGSYQSASSLGLAFELPLTPTNDPAGVPEPGSLVLAGTGLIGLIGATRNRRRRNSSSSESDVLTRDQLPAACDESN